MNTNDRQDQKHRRAKRRNFVAKNNKHKSKRHASLKDYRRKPKHTTTEADALFDLRSSPE